MTPPRAQLVRDITKAMASAREADEELILTMLEEVLAVALMAERMTTGNAGPKLTGH